MLKYFNLSEKCQKLLQRFDSNSGAYEAKVDFIDIEGHADQIRKVIGEHMQSMSGFDQARKVCFVEPF